MWDLLLRLRGRMVPLVVVHPVAHGLLLPLLLASGLDAVVAERF
jgi:hypothetical protein